VNLGAALSTSFLITLVRPATWLLALVSFLLRGGIVIVVAPIIVMPCAAGAANVIAPFLTSYVFGGASTAFVALLVGLIMGGLIWLFVGGLVAAAAESEQIVIVASDEELGAPRAAARAGSTPGRSGSPVNVLAVRLIAMAPTFLALAWGSVRIVGVTYRELTVPSDITLPIAIRVVLAAPESVAVLMVAWLAGQVVGAVAARQVVLAGTGVVRGLGHAVGFCLRHPARVLILELVPLAGLLLVIAPTAAAAAAAWLAIGASFRSDAGPAQTIGLVILFVLLWTGGLLLVAVMSAWRNAAWTVALARTFGATGGDPPGEWNPAAESGTLADLRPRGVDTDAR
jgi:hypothetical protein